MTPIKTQYAGLKSKIDDQLSRWSVAAFGIGAAGEAVYLGLFNTFITIFYNQVIGLSNTLIGTAIMLALVVDAITDPLIGIISDKWKSKLGRRHPFLFAAPIPLALAIYAIFNPPESILNEADNFTNYALFAWLAICTVFSRAFLTLYSIPHLALGGEMSKNHNERSRLFSANAGFSYVTGALFGFLAWGVFFDAEHIRAVDGVAVPGHLNEASYAPLILLACSLVLVAIWTSAAGTYKHVPTLSAPPQQQQALSLKGFFKEILATLKCRNYVMLIAGYFFFMIASGIYDTLSVFMNTYFWGLVPGQMRWFGLVSAPCALFGALISPVLMRKFDRKPVVIFSLICMAITAQLVVDLRLLGLMPDNHSPALLPLLLCNSGVFAFVIGLGAVAMMSMIGDVVDENELDTGLRQEGLFYSARAFFAKASFSFGHFVAGVGLDLFVRFPSLAVPGSVDADVLFRMGMLAGPIMGIAAFIAIFFYGKYHLTHSMHSKIVDDIEERRRNQQESIAKAT